MKEIPENRVDAREFLLSQMALIKQESENGGNLAELSHALVEVVDCYQRT